MKILTRATLIAALAASFSLQAGLEDILAPLPEPKPVERAEETSVEKETGAAKQATPAQPASQVFYPIYSDDLQSELELALQERYRPSGDLRLMPLRDLPDLSGYSHPFTVKLVAYPNRLGRENIQLRFQVENERGVLGEWAVPFRPHLLSEVWIVKAHLSRGDLASPSDFEIRELDILRESEAVPANLEVLLRHEYSRDLTPGRPLLWADLSERSLVRKGDLVEVIASRGLLAITMRAEAKQDGAEGDMIVLRNIDSSKVFSGKVVGENRVEVTF